MNLGVTRREPRFLLPIVKLLPIVLVGAGLVIVGACSSNGGSGGSGNSGGRSGGAGTGNDASSGNGGDSGDGGSAGTLIPVDGGTTADAAPEFVENPTTCAQALEGHSYVGCDYWPTVVANNVWSIFDFAVVVANTGTLTASVNVTGPNGFSVQGQQVPPNELITIYLPWVAALKGQDSDNCGSATPISASVLSQGGAYHLVSSSPVTVYQFNALEYKGQGGPPNKDWSSCPGDTVCASSGTAVGCFSFTNDASMLLPSTAMTGNYRVAGYTAWADASMPTYVAITATADNTTVQFTTAGKVVGGGGLNNMTKGQTASISLNAGDVIEIVGGNAAGDDLSGSLVAADHPVQVITGMPCVDIPTTAQACDHIEETVFPAETLGNDYVVSMPAGPNANATKVKGQIVRIVGNFDNTTLTFDPPLIGPTTINAGQVLVLPTQLVDFRVYSGAGDGSDASDEKSFIVSTFMEGGTLVSTNGEGDPSQSFATATAQYRSHYVFLAPADYDMNFVSIVAGPGTTVTLDGTALDPSIFSAVGSSQWSVARVALSQNGSHVIDATDHVGIQVYGYGQYTSYEYPGGLNLKSISQPPPK